MCHTNNNIGLKGDMRVVNLAILHLSRVVWTFSLANPCSPI